MNNTPEHTHSEEMREEYDFTHAVRGKYAKRFPHDVVMVTLEPDVAAAFPDAASVNEALRVLIKAAKKVSLPHSRRMPIVQLHHFADFVLLAFRAITSVTPPPSATIDIRARRTGDSHLWLCRRI